MSGRDDAQLRTLIATVREHQAAGCGKDGCPGIGVATVLAGMQHWALADLLMTALVALAELPEGASRGQ